MDERLERLALELFEAGAIEFGSFPFKIHEKYPDFSLSPNKINLRLPDNGGNLTSDLVVKISWEMWKKAVISGAYPHFVAGLPKSGGPFGKAVAQYAHKPLLQMAKESYSNGQRRIVSVQGNNYKTGQRVLVIDDVISQAQTKMEGIAAIESVGLRVVAIIVAIDREEGGAEYLQTLGYCVLSIFSFSGLLRFYQRISKITLGQLEDSLAYSREIKKLFLQTLPA